MKRNMRIVVWNCNMALHRKWEALMSLQPDVAIIAESAQPEVLRARGCDLEDLSLAWGGKIEGNRNKGLLVLARKGYELELAPSWDPSLEIFLPLQVSGPESFRLLAVWSFNRRATGSKTPTPDAFARYREWIGEGMILGDFNNNVCWDRPRGCWTFGNFVQELNSLGYASLYHERNRESLGEETKATMYWRSRRPDRDRYHVDYFFAHEKWSTRCSHFEVGSFEEWVGNKRSDHVPLIADFDRALERSMVVG